MTHYWSLRKITQRFDPPKVLAGRGGAIRCFAGVEHFLFAVAYVPPYPNKVSKIPAWHETIRKLFQWLHFVFSQCPERCTPMLSLDLNDGLGTKDGCQIVDKHIGRFHPSAMGTAATFLYELLRAFDLCAINTFFDNPVTFYGMTPGSKSRIDFLCIPCPLFSAMHKCDLGYAQARKLQLIKDKRERDHIPNLLQTRPASWCDQPALLLDVAAHREIP